VSATALVFMGGIRPLPPENQPTGMYKNERLEPAWLGREGLVGDAQADRRVHGGPEKALHQYPLAGYARLAAAFPAAAAALLPGSLGENLSAAGWDETNVAIGDVFRFGDARIQVAQPRSPCWKIDRRFGVDGMTRLIDTEGITGWYFRVLDEGEVGPGCAFERIDAASHGLTIAELWRLWRQHRPDPDLIEARSATPGLAAGWVQKLTERAKWLRDNGGTP
jgi:MOSC domain-containing protein YiiM